MGFTVGIDLDVRYGEDLTRFMNMLHGSKHVLMVIDTNYVKRADTVPESGVATENRLIQKFIHYMKLGGGSYTFALRVSDRDETSIYVYRDPVKEVGLIPLDTNIRKLTATDASEFLRFGRTVKPNNGQSVVLLNDAGKVCIVTIRSITPEKNEKTYSPASVTFDYHIFIEE